MTDPNRVPEAKVSGDGSRVDVYDGPKLDHDSHTVIHTAADGWTTQDLERVDRDHEPLVNTEAFQGNVISGSEQYE